MIFNLLSKCCKLLEHLNETCHFHTFDIVCSVAELCRMFALGIVYFLCGKSKTFRVAAKKQKKRKEKNLCVTVFCICTIDVCVYACILGLDKPLPA